MIVDCLDKEKVFGCILERDDVQGILVVMSNQLSMEMRLLHHISTQILVLKIGQFDFITERELMPMVTLVQG